jgi:hypothetical protein|tara:strand:+ start:115 stop:552 length:438 start_codon:yes stop_codon:yes gene_type:complete
MAISSALTTSFKKELLQGVHNFASGGNSFKLALYAGATASLGATTTAYATSLTGQITGTNYTAGGAALTPGIAAPSSTGTTAFVDFANLTFSTATITASGCLIYNDTNSDKSVATISFGASKTSTAGDFTIVFPTAGANAIITIA